MDQVTLTGFYESLTGAEECAIRERFGIRFPALSGYPLLRAAQFRR